MNTTAQEFYDRQIAFLVANDTDGLIDTNYEEDAHLIAFDFVIKGREALKEHFKGYMQQLGYIKLISTDSFQSTDDSLFFEATVETQMGRVVVYDVFYIRDEKIYRHYTGVKQFLGQAE